MMDKQTKQTIIKETSLPPTRRRRMGGGRLQITWDTLAPTRCIAKTRNGTQEWDEGDAQDLIDFLLAFVAEARSATKRGVG